jgi:hypothetical protein
MRKPELRLISPTYREPIDLAVEPGAIRCVALTATFRMIAEDALRAFDQASHGAWPWPFERSGFTIRTREGKGGFFVSLTDAHGREHAFFAEYRELRAWLEWVKDAQLGR